MKKNKFSFLHILSVLFISSAVILFSCRSGGDNKKSDLHPDNDFISLFDGESLAGWHVVLKDENAPADSTFWAKDGILYSSGKPFGYIRTTAKYSDYDFNVQWRWPEEPGNSGVFIHINEDKVFPTCLECQLKSGKAGDFVAFEGVHFEEHSDTSTKVVAKRTESTEKPSGEWNTYDIRVRGDSVSIYVNGVLQNIASGLNIDHGWIALQSEGAPVEFKDIRIKILN